MISRVEKLWLQKPESIIELSGNRVDVLPDFSKRRQPQIKAFSKWNRRKTLIISLM